MNQNCCDVDHSDRGFGYDGADFGCRRDGYERCIQSLFGCEDLEIRRIYFWRSVFIEGTILSGLDSVFWSLSNLQNESNTFTRFTNILNALKNLGKVYSTPENVRKIIRSLPKSWEAKVTAIQEANDLTKLEEAQGRVQKEEKYSPKVYHIRS